MISNLTNGVRYISEAGVYNYGGYSPSEPIGGLFMQQSAKMALN